MTPAQFATLVREYTGTTTSSFSDARMLVLMNIYKDELCRRVQKFQDDYFTVPQTTPLIAGQREYNLPVDMLNQIRRVEIDFVGDGDYTLAFEEKFNILESSLSEATVKAKFTDQRPKYYVLRKAIWLLTASTIPAVDAGLRIYAPTLPPNWVDLASTVDMSEDPTSVTVGFPSPLHELLARRVSISYKGNRTRPIPLSESEQKYDADLKEVIDQMTSITRNEKIQVKLPYNTGAQY